MAPKRLISGENKPKMKNVVTTIERKKEIIDKYEKGARITDLAAEYGMAKSTVATILKNKEAIKGADVAMGVKKQLNPLAHSKFRKNHFHILHCLRLIDKAWGQVSVRSLQSAWENLWPICVTAKDFEGFEPSVQESAVVEDIVSLGRAIGIEVDSDDVEELVQAHSEDLTTDELRQLHQEQLQEVTEELSSGEEEGNSKERVSTAEIKKYLRQWTELGNFLERCHPDIAAVHRNINQFDENLMQHFRDIWKKRQRQITLDRFLLKKESSESASVSEPQPSTSGFTGITPGDELPDGDLSSDE